MEMTKLRVKDNTWSLGRCLISNPSWVLVFSFCRRRLRYTERVTALSEEDVGVAHTPEAIKQNAGIWVKAQKMTLKPGTNGDGDTEC